MLLLTENDSALKVAQQITFRELVAYKKIKVYANSYIWFQKTKNIFIAYGKSTLISQKLLKKHVICENKG